MQNIPHETAVKAFRKLGFNVELRELQITVLREAEFPFRRLTLPNHSLISQELLEVYLDDLQIDKRKFRTILDQFSVNGQASSQQ